MAATNLFGNIINIHPFEGGNGRICHLILGHVLMQKKCCLFPVILRQKTLHKGNKDVRQKAFESLHHDCQTFDKLLG